MDRRSFLKGMLGTSAVIGAVAAPASVLAAASRPRLLIQQSPLAGFQYHEGESLWPLLSVGAPLRLLREPENTHDARAVAVRFMGRRIGYLPRLENTAVSQMLDRGVPLTAEIAELSRSQDPWQRVQLRVEVVL